MSRKSAKELFAQIHPAVPAVEVPVQAEPVVIETPHFVAEVVGIFGGLSLSAESDSPLSTAGFKPRDKVLVIRLSTVG